MNGLLKSWADSLKVFIPGNFKLFFLVTLKSFLEGVKVFLTYFWWLLALGFGSVYFGYYYGRTVISYNDSVGLLVLDQYATGLISLVYVLLLLFWIISIRPSVGIKDSSYFRRYALYSLSSIIVLFFFMGLVGYVILGGASLIASESVRLAIISILSLFASLFMYYLLFFWFESDGSLNSLFATLKRAVKFVIFNIPGILIFGVALRFVLPKIEIGVWLTTLNMPQALLVFAGSLLLQFIALCFLHNYFIKRVHDHSELYYS